ncbi:MAG TPA: pyridoxal-phosphate dependent enzyme [Cyclobacteriaceae bacterium]|nr:pyridoxal-phosphate dependent enzyme [Cyclobacteriaceae bacterium]
MITKQAIEEAHERIKKYVHRTPVMTSKSIDEKAGCSIFFKCENLQNVGAFKARGAMNAALQLTDDQKKKGIATHSSGNHAQAIARAAQILGIKSYIVMPRTTPQIKKNGVIAYGGEIFECEPNIAARETMLAEVIKKTGAVEIHPFNNYEVMIGQATAAKELFEEAPKLDYLLAPVGGGGLLSGTAYAAKHFSPATTVIAGEPAGSDDTFRSLKSGKIEPAQSQTIADGLLTTVGDKTFPIIHELVKEVITVSEEEIVAAMRLVWERLKIVIEPSAAVPFASVLKSKEKFKGKRVGIILSGGNVDLERAAKLFA